MPVQTSCVAWDRQLRNQSRTSLSQCLGPGWPRTTRFPFASVAITIVSATTTNVDRDGVGCDGVGLSANCLQTSACFSCKMDLSLCSIAASSLMSAKPGSSGDEGGRITSRSCPTTDPSKSLRRGDLEPNTMRGVSSAPVVEGLIMSGK